MKPHIFYSNPILFDLKQKCDQHNCARIIDHQLWTKLRELKIARLTKRGFRNSKKGRTIKVIITNRLLSATKPLPAEDSIPSPRQRQLVKVHIIPCGNDNLRSDNVPKVRFATWNAKSMKRPGKSASICDLLLNINWTFSQSLKAGSPEMHATTVHWLIFQIHFLVMSFTKNLGVIVSEVASVLFLERGLKLWRTKQNPFLRLNSWTFRYLQMDNNRSDYFLSTDLHHRGNASRIVQLSLANLTSCWRQYPSSSVTCYLPETSISTWTLTPTATPYTCLTFFDQRAFVST